ncbi:hypothetical protein MM221_20820 [Salipaludibacillus sp. LMS25]|jgi:hypothetical protein|uniref:hypothetical protein n=1 Tax=Salipaludibacillus sp. LMS25 TaxID=2924031 RepID=UPI0020D01B2B|nr:hypothetical protein [Salipaludibacillus sp. LMS25]UTR14944.1 hypothetical protein MM221_20820 [Salipaludibacillus sp. LMS25]
MKKMAIITEQPNTLNLNSHATAIRLGLTKDTYSLPLTSYHLTQVIDTYSPIILQEPLSPTDSLIQGSTHDVHPLIVHLITL